MEDNQKARFQLVKHQVDQWFEKSRVQLEACCSEINQRYYEGSDEFNNGSIFIIELLMTESLIVATITVQIPRFSPFSYIEIDVIDFEKESLQRPFYWNDNYRDVSEEEINRALEHLMSLLINLRNKV